MRTVTAFVTALLLASGSRADSGEIGSLREERELFPDAIEVITGKLVRHSPAFYKWQIQDREKRLAAEPTNPALTDELAVAHAMTGDRDRAIALMEKQAADHPDRYEPHACLAQFFFLKKDFAKVLVHADRALAISPDANSGREKYLRWIAEYALEKPAQRLPLGPVDRNAEWPHRPKSFATFLRGKLDKPDLDLGDAQAAVRAVLEIMRFGANESTLLLEVLGDVLAYSSDPAKPYPKRLAARAYLRAAYTSGSPGVRGPYITLAEWALVHRAKDRDSYNDNKEAMRELSRLFAEVDDATAWHDELAAKEGELVAGSADPEVTVKALYAAQPRVPDDPDDSWYGGDGVRLFQLLAIGVSGAIILVLLLFFAGRLIRRRRKPSSIA